MVENGATRQSQRIRASGFRVCHYFLEEDGIDTEASFRQKIEGCFSPSTDIGAVERNTLDANLSEVILNGRPTKLLRSSEVVHSWGIRRRRKRRPPKLPKAYQNLAAEEQRCDVSCFVSGGPNGMEGCREHVKDDMGLKLAQYTAEPLLQYTAYNVQTRCREYENAVNGFFSQQNQELRGYVTDPELTTKTTCVSVDHAGENARNNIENHSQNMISVCHEGNRFSIATSNQALVGQLNHASSQVIGKFESERRPSNCRKVMGMPDQLNRCVRESLNHITTVQQIQGFGNELHVTGVNQYNTHGFGSFHEMMSICEQRSHYSSADQNVDQNRRLPQDVSFQQEENAQACYNGVVLNMPKRSIHDTNWFPFSNCKQTESSPSCNASSTDYLTFTPEWTPVQISDSLDSGQSMTMNSNANLSHLAFGHSEYPASQLSIWGNNAVPIQHSSKLSVFHEASNSSGTCPSSKSSPEYAQTQASTNQLNTVDPNFNNRDLSYVSSNTDLFQQDETSSLKGVSCSGTILPSSSPMDLECLDANSAGDVHHRDSSISCFNKDSKKERLSDLRVKMRNTHLVGNNTSTTQRSEGQAGRTNSGIGRSLRKLLSGIRNGNNCIGTNSGAPHNDDPPKKLRRKKVRCKVQKDETKRKGRGGRRKNPLHANLQREGFSFQGHKLYSVISSIIEAKNLSGMSPLEGRKAKRPNNRPVILMRSCSQDNPPFNEDCNIPSEISNIGEKMNFYDLNTSMDENYEAGFKTNYIDFLAKSDQRNLSQTKDTVSTFECPQAGMFSILPCQELALYGNPMHQNRHGKELLLSHFTADGFETLSLSAGGSLETSNIVPYKRSMDRLLHKMPVQGSSGNLQLAKLNRKDELQMVLYNQKRDIVASKIRAYKKIRAKVLLDSESQRVWLQLENGAEPRDEDDPDKARHWEKQREDMRQIVDSFIKKMHDVQGNRKFSPWKGSIVDSVVGAFLTQNVSDHLSSSAFMSVASRFPPASKKDSPASCSVLRERFCSQRHFEIGSIPLEKVALSSAIEPAFYEEHDGNSGFTDEIKDVKYDFMEPAVQSSDNKIQASSVGDNIEDTAQYHGDNCISTPVSHTAHYYGDSCVSTPVSHTLVRKQDIVARDDENASMLDAIKDISGTFRQHSEVHSLTARRRLNFGADTKEQTQSFVNPEPDKKVCLAASQEQECASDNISDLHSESESAAGSFGSVHSVQDSNFQTSIIPQDTLELEVGASTVQTSIMMQDPSAVAQVESKVNKKRPMALSSISGIERAQLEVNQKGRKRNHHTDWESVRRQALGLPCGTVKGTDGPDPRSYLHEDSVDWEAVRFAELGVFADTIKERGMHHVLSGRIKAFLNSVHEDHGSIDLEWLRILSPEKAREYLTSIHGLGVKSVECIRLLTLHHHAFPVDTNVGRICVRLGWVPIEPLPEEVQLHLVELYPIQETIQKYLWPRLCTLDQRTLYELHYQLITFGKVSLFSLSLSLSVF
ncbi:hypothetical protein KP509_09G028100 [Ceratopteris richardii]|uniref:HhH-GPD domain-containing protein n=1 Tax=Ceratopteris richardii TaxID=49495 RepID=A0A8T2U6K8_CERRI|nr:hypothetical protein KP509_09G028100 [Ceratopteris richardii]